MEIAVQQPKPSTKNLQINFMPASKTPTTNPTLMNKEAKTPTCTTHISTPVNYTSPKSASSQTLSAMKPQNTPITSPFPVKKGNVNGNVVNTQPDEIRGSHAKTNSRHLERSKSKAKNLEPSSIGKLKAHFKRLSYEPSSNAYIQKGKREDMVYFIDDGKKGTGARFSTLNNEEVNNQPNLRSTLDISERRNTLPIEGEIHYKKDGEKLVAQATNRIGRSPHNPQGGKINFASFHENKENIPDFYTQRDSSLKGRCVTSPGEGDRKRKGSGERTLSKELSANKSKYSHRGSSHYHEGCVRMNPLDFYVKSPYGLDMNSDRTQAYLKNTMGSNLRGAGPFKSKVPSYKVQINKRKTEITQCLGQIDASLAEIVSTKEKVYNREKQANEDLKNMKENITKLTGKIIEAIQQYSSRIISNLEETFHKEISRTTEGLTALRVCEDRAIQLKSYIGDNMMGIIQNVDGEHTKVKNECAADINDFNIITNQLHDILKETSTINPTNVLTDFSNGFKAIVMENLGLEDTKSEEKRLIGVNDSLMKSGAKRKSLKVSSSTKKRVANLVISFDNKDIFENALQFSSKTVVTKSNQEGDLALKSTNNLTEDSENLKLNNIQAVYKELKHEKSADKNQKEKDAKSFMKDLLEDESKSNISIIESLETLPEESKLRKFVGFLSKVNENQKNRTSYLNKNGQATGKENDAKSPISSVNKNLVKNFEDRLLNGDSAEKSNSHRQIFHSPSFKEI